uniref:Amine oxidase n=1 Tax=Arcella intermedia TaxID=1963864 RepID=A0A6B2L4V7_9EUKA
MGGQWIGYGHDRILQYAQRYNLALDPQPYFTAPPDNASAAERTLTLVEAVNYPGLKLSQEEFEETERFLGWIDELSKELDLVSPWTHPQAASLDKLSLAEVIQTKVRSPSVRHHILLFAQTVLACDPAEVSFFFFLSYLLAGGGFEALGDGEQGAQKWKVKGGIEQISHRMAEDFIAGGGKVFYKSPVGKVRKASGEYFVHSPSQVWRAARVVFAMSPLLVSKMEFEPPLAEGKARLCAGFFPPRCIKTFAVYDTPFWLGDRPKGSPAPHFTNLGPAHNVFHADLGEGRYALVGLVTGAPARDFQGKDPNQLRQAVVDQYAAMYGPLASSPRFFLSHDWSTEEHSGGCFASLLPPNVLSQHGSWLKKPFEGTYWCSTETADQYCGYFEGAIRAGDRVTSEILADLSKPIPNAKL